MALGVVPAPSAASAQEQAATALETLSLEQSRLADKYLALEQLMIRMAEFEAATNPQRAALLKRAARQSSERLTRNQLNSVARLLTPPAQLKRAIDEQEVVLKDMQALLQLLLSENRSDRLKKERERIREYIKEVARLIRLELSLKGETEGGADTQRLAENQGRIADRAGQLSDRIREDEGLPAREAESASAEPETTPEGEAKELDQPSQDGSDPSAEPAEDPQGPNQPPSDEGPTPASPQSEEANPAGDQPSEPQPSGSPSQPGSPSPSSPPSPGSPPPSQGQGSGSPPSQQQPPQNPAQQRIEAAQQRMQQAQQRLEKAERDEAIQEQEQARRELELAKAELERILRQLREEEVERVLASLEERFRRMLEMQLKIYEVTQQLDELPIEERGRDVDIQASQLSYQESKLVLEADKALTLLREEGSSVAFPESVEQMRDDMEDVAVYLEQRKVGPITQAAEESIIDALQEMIAALQQAQQDLEEQRQQQQQQQPAANPDDMPLVDQLAELRMIRALQMRVNTRTERCARFLEDLEDPIGQATDAELRAVLEKLSGRQQRIHEVTRDIVLGKNR